MATYIDSHQIPSTQLLLSSGNGPVSRTVLQCPPRDAEPSEIPVIDVSGLASSSLADRKLVAQKIHEAATNTGFFYISHHGIPESVINAARKACLDFFQQPVEVKQRANINKSSCFNGYKPPASQRINPFEAIDKREGFSVMYDPRYDPSVHDITAIPKEIAAQLHSEDFHWEATSNLPDFKRAIIDYWRACLGLARALIRCFALSLELDEDFFDSKVSHPDAVMALNYYPPLEAVDNLELSAIQSAAQEVSIGSHTDFQLFTILWQDESGGLQVLNREGQWINAKPLEGTFVINIADYMQRITNDRYVSTVHRAKNTSGRERISMPFFVGFNWNESCDVLDSCVAPGETKKYDEISCADWVKRRARATYQTEGIKEAS
ncbi:2OG-Fe(II) oxygenase [Stachybotrys elegans]|uniref:2OG-Fe(II) oxygenase n=1 Tax=Stachybotrys elegans TaxID=80388 RepID=A0A8K0WKP8_9HYPO|nr:2OG-Fe(II) oxygenase [Stachybotrys elegans]